MSAQPAITRADIVAEAMTWLRTPYHHQARKKGEAVDCAQLLFGIYVEALGLSPVFEIEDYPRDWMTHRDEERFLSYVTTRTAPVSVPQPGDIALYKVGRCFAHGAVVIDWPTVLHADSQFKCVTLADGAQGRLAGREVLFFDVLAGVQA